MELQERNQEVIDRFRKRKGKQLIATVPLVLAIIPLAIMEESTEQAFLGIPSSILLPICIAVVIAGIIFSIFNWRCPSCSGYLGKAFSPKFCTKCGAQLQ